MYSAAYRKRGLMPIFDKSQLMRGALEGVILKIISIHTTYGYEILELLKKSGFIDISEGTIYPMLLRLEKQGSIVSELRNSPLGPKRKYYTVTDSGKRYPNDFVESWKQLSGSVNKIVDEKAGQKI